MHPCSTCFLTQWSAVTPCPALLEALWVLLITSTRLPNDRSCSTMPWQKCVFPVPAMPSTSEESPSMTLCVAPCGSKCLQVWCGMLSVCTRVGNLGLHLSRSFPFASSTLNGLSLLGTGGREENSFRRLDPLSSNSSLTVLRILKVNSCSTFFFFS